MKFTSLLLVLPLLVSADAVTVDRTDDATQAYSDTTAQSTGFEGFGGFGGFRGFHQINGFMSNAFGDLEGQFDSTGFDKDFSASQNRRFDAGYGQHFLDEIDHDSFGSGLGSSSNQQKQGRPVPAAAPSPVIYSVNEENVPRIVPRYHQPLPTTKHSVNSQRRPQPQLGKATSGKKSYPISKYAKVLDPYKVQQGSNPYQGHYTENRPHEQIPGGYGRVLPAQNLKSPNKKYFQGSSTNKNSAKLVQHVAQNPVARQHNPGLRDFAENYKPDEGFTFGAEKFY